jgi:hypothetical protein
MAETKQGDRAISLAFGDGIAFSDCIHRWQWLFERSHERGNPLSFVDRL